MRDHAEEHGDRVFWLTIIGLGVGIARLALAPLQLGGDRGARGCRRAG
jgi:hypothetical protein